MITELNIAKFRGIAHGEVSGLKPLTALVGANNSGKSAILEALYLAGSEGNFAALAKVVKVRGWVGPESVRATTYRNQGQCIIGIKPHKHAPQGTWTLELRVGQDRMSTSVYVCGVPRAQLLIFNHDGGTPFDKGNNLDLGAVFIDIGSIHEAEGLERLFSDAVAAGAAVEEHLTALCSMLRPATKQLRILVKDDRSLLHTIDADGSCAIHFAGDGMRRLFAVACYLAVAKGRLVLIEEPECFQHPIAMDEFVKLIWAAIAQGTQVVFSTHSLELLSLVFAKEDGRDLSKTCVVRTKLADGELITLNIDGPNASERMAEVGEDLRR